jgi:NitT/TauT family transport system ATP-binding protein
MIKVANISFAYPAQPNLFSGFSLDISRGTSLAVIGPSGCGKSTLLYLLGGLLRAASGKIAIDGVLLQRPRPQTGLVLQDHGLLPWGTVWDNVNLGLKIRRFYGPDGKHAPLVSDDSADVANNDVVYWLKRLEIDGLRDKYPAQLSRGQRQRTAIARTLVLSPDLLLMDEPFSALDAAIRYDLQTTMIELHRERGMTSVTVTHDIEEALFMGEMILVMKAAADGDVQMIENGFAGKAESRNTVEYKLLNDRLRRMLERSK